MGFNGPRQDDSLYVFADSDKILCRILMRYAFYVLVDYRPFIEFRRGVVCCCSDHLYSAFVSPLIWARSLECRQKGMMDVDNFSFELLHKRFGENLHVTSQHHEIYMILLEKLVKFTLLLLFCLFGDRQ